jgi:hypothetical protein
MTAVNYTRLALELRWIDQVEKARGPAMARIRKICGREFMDACRGYADEGFRFVDDVRESLEFARLTVKEIKALAPFVSERCHIGEVLRLYLDGKLRVPLVSGHPDARRYSRRESITA